MAKPARKPEPRTPMTWLDGEKHGTQWVARDTPKGERAPARIQMSSRNRDGSYSYFCYRDAMAVAVAKSLDDAKAACERGKSPRLSDSVIAYVRDHSGELPPFLALTEGERRAVRGQYAHAMPAPRELGRALDREQRGALDAANTADPGTRKLLDELRTRESAAGSGQRSTRGAKRDALADTSARITLVMAKQENPAKAGTKRHAGYEILLGCARRGASVQEYLDEGGKDLRLAKAVRSGIVELKKGEK